MRRERIILPVGDSPGPCPPRILLFPLLKFGFGPVFLLTFFGKPFVFLSGVLSSEDWCI